MQLHLDDIAVFTRIAELGSLSAAARERNVPVSQVTRSLARLEAAAKVRLLHRSTHGLSLTDEGDTFLNYGRQLLATRDVLAGELTGTPNSDTLVARQIGDYSRSLYAAPSYLARCGTPQHPDDLAQHHLIASSVSLHRNRWLLKPEPGHKTPRVLEVTGHTRTDNSAVTLSLVQQGVGIGQLTDLLARPLVASGALVSLLPEHFERPRVPVFAVMLQERQRLPKIRACIDYWAQWLAQMTQAAAR